MDFEEFEFPVDNQTAAKLLEKSARSLLSEEEDYAILENSFDELRKLLIKDSLAPSFRNSISVSVLETLCMWQVKGIFKSNIALFLHYSRFGHFVHLRSVAIDALILTDSFKTENIVVYIARIILHDPDFSIRYFAAKSVANFLSLCCYYMDQGYYPESHKKTLIRSLKVLGEIFSSCS